MRAFLIVKLDIASYPLAQRSRVLKFVYVDAFVFERAEESLRSAVVRRTAFAVHRYLDAFLLKELQVGSVCKMRALVAVHDLWLAAAECSFEAPEHEALLQRAGQLVIDDLATVPVDDEKQVHKALAHPQIRDVDSPDLVRAFDREAAEQVGSRVSGMKPLAQVWLRIDGFKPHNPHETAHTLAINLKALIPEESRHAPVAEIGMLHIDFVDAMHELHILFTLALLPGWPIDACPIYRQQLRLALNRDLRVVLLHHGFACFSRFI